MIRYSASSSATDEFWRSLTYFALYRLVLGAVLLVAALGYREVLNLGYEDVLLFERVASTYLILAAGFMVTLWRRYPGFGAQLFVQVVVDVVCLTLMMHASGGLKSGIAVMLMVVLAGAGLVGQGRMTLFYAALASLAILLEESWRAITRDADPADFVRTGLTCIAFFGTAVTARLLGRRVVSNEDLARRRGAELERQSRVSARIIRDMNDGVMVVDADGSIRQANPAAESLMSTQLRGARLANVAAGLASRMAAWTGRQAETTDVLRAPDGRPLRVRFLPAEEVSGDTLVYLEDIEQIQAQAQQLKLAALGRLTANIAHEIRNPLAAISHAAELMAEEEADPLRLRLARIVGDNALRLNRLVTDVLELGRRDRAEPEFIRWRVFARAFLEELQLHDESTLRRVVLIGTDAELRFDRGHLHRVLWNLLSNALRHATGDAGSILLDLVESRHPGRYELHVWNDGPPLDERTRAQVFEPFFTTHGTGTGLGLYIARELCEASGATLDLLPSTSGAHFRILVEGRR